MEFLLSRRQFAFHESVDQLFANNRGECYMWTFTWKKPHTDKYYAHCWKRFLERCAKRFPLLRGLRVFEMHPGSANLFGESHGLHVHAVINERLNIHRVKKLTDECGFGRIHVQKCSPAQAKYLAKYLTKKADYPLPKGMRAFGTIGMKSTGGFTKVRDISMTSQFTENVTTWQQILKRKQMTPDYVHTIFVNTKLYGKIEDWPVNRLYYHGENARKAIAPLTLPKARRKSAELIARKWKTLAGDIMKKSVAISPPEAEKIFGKSTRGVPGVSCIETETRLDIGADYWDKFPGKTDGTRIAYYRVCRSSPKLKVAT